MPVVIVDGKQYDLNEQQAAAMLYLKEAVAIEKGNITITNIDQKTFEFILKILQTVDYNIPTPAKVTKNVLEDVIGKDLAKLIGDLNPKELNNLFRAAHYLKIVPLRKCVAAVAACKVWIEPTLEHYNQKRNEIGLKEELTTEKSKQYKDRFPFMN